MIVDDGSTDGTQELVRSWIERGEIAIDYVKTVNGGKPRAINLGVSRCDSPLFFVVDSDDWLLPLCALRRSASTEFKNVLYGCASLNTLYSFSVSLQNSTVQLLLKLARDFLYRAVNS